MRAVFTDLRWGCVRRSQFLQWLKLHAVVPAMSMFFTIPRVLELTSTSIWIHKDTFFVLCPPPLKMGGVLAYPDGLSGSPVGTSTLVRTFM